MNWLSRCCFLKCRPIFFIFMLDLGYLCTADKIHVSFLSGFKQFDENFLQPNVLLRSKRDAEVATWAKLKPIDKREQITDDEQAEALIADFWRNYGKGNLDAAEQLATDDNLDESLSPEMEFEGEALESRAMDDKYEKSGDDFSAGTGSNQAADRDRMYYLQRHPQPMSPSYPYSPPSGPPPPFYTETDQVTDRGYSQPYSPNYVQTPPFYDNQSPSIVQPPSPQPPPPPPTKYYDAMPGTQQGPSYYYRNPPVVGQSMQPWTGNEASYPGDFQYYEPTYLNPPRQESTQPSYVPPVNQPHYSDGRRLGDNLQPYPPNYQRPQTQNPLNNARTVPVNFQAQPSQTPPHSSYPNSGPPPPRPIVMNQNHGGTYRTPVSNYPVRN